MPAAVALASALASSSPPFAEQKPTSSRPRIVEGFSKFSSRKSYVFVSHPPTAEFRLPADLSESVLHQQEIVVRQAARESSALIDPAQQLEPIHLCVPKTLFGLMT